MPDKRQDILSMAVNCCTQSTISWCARRFKFVAGFRIVVYYLLPKKMSLICLDAHGPISIIVDRNVTKKYKISNQN